MHDANARYPVSIVIPVAWGDMDAFQHVNNVTYGRWLESARIAYFRRIGFMSQSYKTPPKGDKTPPWRAG